MSAASGPGHSSPPPTSAAVLEFICLFTHDLRRKQKRWQDGRLKYHSFNKRAMVYDDRGNFVGDLHWRRDYDFDEGEEIQLERGGVLVQVQDLVHRTEQDLSELLDKRVKEKEQRQVQAAARPSVPSAALPRTVVRPNPTGHFQTRHRPLHQVIGTPSGHHGKAVVPKNSPYEQRHQPVESPDERAAKRRKYGDPPPSKSGYAQALFGQSLNLSATPMSSVPVRRLPARETVRKPELSSSAETNAQQVREEPKPALREQPKSSRHFNQPAESQSAVSKAAESRPVHDVEVDNQPQVRRKQDRSLHQIPHVEHQNDSSTADDDVIEIEDPGPPALARPKKAEKVRPESARICEQTSERPTVNTLLTKVSKTKAARPDEGNHQIHGYRDLYKTEERLAKLKKLKSTAPKAAVKRSTAQVSASKEPEPQLTGLQRRPSEPITELRIKSTKKRGLLMVSETRLKLREQQSSNSAASRATSEELLAKGFDGSIDILRFPSPQPYASSEMDELGKKGKTTMQQTSSTELEVDENPFRPPSPPPPHAGLEKDEIGWKRKVSKRRRDSTELGEHDNFSWSPSPAPRAQTVFDAGRSIVEQSEDGEGAESFWQDQDVAPGSTANLHIEIDGLQGKPATEVAQNTAPSSPHRQRRYDPYQLPSSSLEELSTNSARAPRGPTTKAFPSQGHAPDRESISSCSKINHADHVKNTGKAKQPRRMQRNIVLDEEDLDELSEFPDQATVNLDQAINSDYDSNLHSSKKQAEPRRSSRATKSNLSRQDRKEKIDAKKDSLGDDFGEAEPENAPKAIKRKAKAQEKNHGPEAEEQPHKRRRSNRRKGSRAVDLEETSLQSEQDDFEDESTLRRSRKSKTNKVKEDRPRLTTIKKSVKSRELVGFDLAALHAPLGLRGIGVPFSILSSPVNESTMTRTHDQHMTVKISDSTAKNSGERLPVDTSNTLEAIFEANGMAVETSPATAENDEKLAAPTSPPEGQLVSGKIAGEPSERVQPQTPTLTANLAARESGLLGQKCGNQSNDKMDACSNVSLPNEESALPSPREKRSNDEIQNKDRTGVMKAKVGVTRVSKKMLLSAVPTDKPTAESAIATIRQQGSVEDSRVISEPDTVLAGSKSAICTGSTSTTSAVQPTAALLEASLNLWLQSSRRGTSHTDGKGPGVAEVSDKAHDATTTIMASVHKQAPSLSQQSSRLSACITKAEKSRDIEATESVCEGFTPAAAQPSRASTHKPTSGLRRPPSAFTPKTKAKIDAAHVETEANIVKTLCDDAATQKPTPALLRLSSDAVLVGNAESNIAAENPDAVQSTRPERASAAPIQPSKSLGLRRTNSATRRINNITVNHLEPELLGNLAGGSSTKLARLANPASRGRKAALKSDAAGQVPQRVLALTQPSVMIPTSTADLASTPLEEPAKKPERPKKKMAFPGFQSAKGEGPWSREAFDLLETGRPE